jgi:hypothetical protein
MRRRTQRRRPAPGDAPEIDSVGGGARRAIRWEELDVERLGAEGRRLVGATWRERMKQEHLAVGAFALLAQELAAEGADPIVLSLITRASSDEVRHAGICKSFAITLLNPEVVEPRMRGLPRIPMHERSNARERVLYHLVEMCCLSETLTGVYLTEMLDRTTDPVARIAIESLLEDEIDHGRVGWAYLAARATEGSTEGLASALPAMLDRTFDRVLTAGRRAPADDSRLETCGFLGAKSAADVYRRVLEAVIVPGFETLGIDLGPAWARIRERAWLS